MCEGAYDTDLDADFLVAASGLYAKHIMGAQHGAEDASALRLPDLVDPVHDLPGLRDSVPNRIPRLTGREGPQQQ